MQVISYPPFLLISHLSPCSVDLPSIPLKMTGPALQHLGKGRPKPARMQRSRPTRNTSSQPAPNTGPEINTAPEGPSTTPPLSPRSPKTPLSPTPLAAMKPRASIIKMPPPPKAKPSKEDEVRSVYLFYSGTLVTLATMQTSC